MRNPIPQEKLIHPLIPLYACRLLILVIVAFLTSPLTLAWDKIDFDQTPVQAEYPRWDAVIIEDQATMEIESNGEALLTQHRIMKIFSDPDKRYSHQEIPFNSSVRVLGIKARTIHPNGDEFVLNPEDITEKSLISELSLYSDVRAKEFYLPRVMRNCVVEYEYQVRLKSLLYWSDWLFQSNLPSLYSGYTLLIPKDFNFRVKVLNAYIEPKIDFKTGKQVFLWENRDNPAIVGEVFMPPPADSVSRLAFSPLEFNFDGRVYPSRNWNDIAAWYRGISQPGIQPTEEIARRAAELTRGLGSTEARIKAIFNYVQEHVRYVSIAIGIGAYQPHLCTDILDNGYGDCKDMTSLTIALLKAINVEAYPVLLSTRGHRALSPKMPKVKQFDHVVAALPRADGYLWLDPACRNCRFGELPFEDQGTAALVVTPDAGELVMTPESAQDENLTQTKWEIKLNSDGSASGSLTIRATGQEELAFRASLTELKPQGRTEALTGFLNSWFLDPYLVKSRFGNFEDRDSNISVQADFLSGAFGVSDQGGLSLPVNLNTQNYLSIMFPHRQRNSPVMFDYRFVNQDDMVIHVPPDLEVEHLPGAVRLDEPFGLFESSYSAAQDTIIHKRLFVRKQLLVPLDQYGHLKEFYDRAAEEDGKRIILKRRSDAD